MGVGYVDSVTHDYEKHVTTTLSAALNVLDGSILEKIAQPFPRISGREH